MTKKDDNVMLVVVAVAILAAYVFVLPMLSGAAAPIGQTGGAPGIGIGCVERIGTDADGIPVTKNVPCSGSVEAIVGGQPNVAYIHLTSTVVAASDTDFTNFELTAARAEDIPTINLILKNQFENDGSSSAIAVNSGPVSRGGSYVFDTLEAGPAATSCGVWTELCDATEIRTFNAPNDRCECMLDPNNFLTFGALPGTRFRTTVAGTYSGGTNTVNSAYYSVLIQPNPSGDFTVQTGLVTG